MRIEVCVEALRERHRSLLWWTIGLAALIALNVAFYPSVRDDPALSDYAKDLPESVRALFVGGELDIASPVGYLNSQVFALMAPLLLLIFAIGAGAAAVAGEEERGTLDLVLAHPVRRRDYVLQRSLALAALVFTLAITLLATVALGSRLVDLKIGFGKLLAASLSVGLLALFFGTVALAAGAIRPGRAAAIAVAAGLAVAAWLLDGFGQAVEALDAWRPLSPYYQALGRNPLREGAAWEGWTILAAATVLIAAAPRRPPVDALRSSPHHRSARPRMRAGQRTASIAVAERKGGEMLARWIPFDEFDSMERRMRRMLAQTGIVPTFPSADLYETDGE